MKKSAFLFLFVSSLFILSCNKKKDDPTPIEDPSPITPIITAGKLEYFLIKSLDPTSFYEVRIANASFYNDKQQLQLVNSVSFNGINLPQRLDGDFYEFDSVSSPSKFNWSVKGKDNIPDFDFNNTSGMPECTGNFLPDSIDHSKSLTIQLSGIKNATHLIVSINSSISNSAYISSNILDTKTPSYTFSPSDLSKLQVGSGLLTVELFNENFQIIAGKTFLFFNRISAYKSIKIY